jgi:hypothetical protein
MELIIKQPKLFETLHLWTPSGLRLDVTVGNLVVVQRSRPERRRPERWQSRPNLHRRPGAIT